MNRLALDQAAAVQNTILPSPIDFWLPSENPR
jgi:hypothetical protein